MAAVTIFDGNGSIIRVVPATAFPGADDPQSTGRVAQDHALHVR